MKLSILILPPVLMLLAFAWAGGEEPSKRAHHYMEFIGRSPDPDTTYVSTITRVELDAMLRRILQQEMRQILQECRKTNEALYHLGKFISEQTELIGMDARETLQRTKWNGERLDTLRKFIDENCKPANGAISESETRKMILIRDSTGVKR